MTRQIKRRYTSYYQLENNMADMTQRMTTVNNNPAVIDPVTYIEGKATAKQATFDSYYNDIIATNSEKSARAMTALDSVTADYRNVSDTNAADYDTWYKDLNTEAVIQNDLFSINDYLSTTLAGASTEDSIQYKFAEIVGVAPEELNVLKEIYDAVVVLDNNYVEGLKAAIDATFETAEGELLNQVDETGDTLEELAALVKTGLLDVAKAEISAIADGVDAAIDTITADCYRASDNCEGVSTEVGAKIRDSFDLATHSEVSAAAGFLPKVMTVTLTTDADGVITIPSTIIEDVYVNDVLNFGRARQFDNDILVEYYLVQKTKEVDGATVPEAGKFILTQDDGTALADKAVDISFFGTELIT